MKAISLLQPWASLIATGSKKIETRGWATKYRGPLAIHASQGFKKEQQLICRREPFLSALTNAGVKVRSSVVRYETVYLDAPFGAIIATCDLVDCIKMTPEFIKSIQRPELDFGEYTVGRVAWILENVKPLEVPVPAKGKLSLWDWEE